jgi:hypothetical protein
VELHYAATNKDWTGKLVQQVCMCVLLVGVGVRMLCLMWKKKAVLVGRTCAVVYRGLAWHRDQAGGSWRRPFLDVLSKGVCCCCCCCLSTCQVIAAGCPVNCYNGTKGSGCTPLVLASSKGQVKVCSSTNLAAWGASRSDCHSRISCKHTRTHT